MGYEWNDRLEAEYTRYVGKKWFQGLNARDREGYLKARQWWKRSRDMGNRFRDGMALLRGQTPDRGYEKEVRLETSLGPRISDVANVSLTKSSEYKAGGSQKEKTLKQLDKDERYIREVPGAMVDWTIVQGARHDKEVRDRIKELEGKYPGQFVVQEITREQRRLALTIGKRLEKQQRAKEKADRARERAEQQRLRQRRERAQQRLENIRRIAKEKQRREQVQAAELAAARQAAKEFPTLEHLIQRESAKPPAKEPKAPETERDRIAREAAETAARDVQKQFRIEPVTPVKAPEKNTAEREAAEQKRLTELQIQREARETQLAQLPPHVAKLMNLGQAHGPERAVETAREEAARAQGRSRDGRDSPGQERSR
ncbi:hypothetical protein [Nocardia brasiliensis]|uniref:Uncharacterized protein n=1 Tax=Nocardia brasiliensis (strain ATCC 700358 / HUJEG-1) TaxID=1133849 RepID=K0ERP6_NOCB7|nr:hypothetical protein [Nocardia brasiliensis]AFT98360.1 hypothetical protein O3I_001990 [Nocardia brasiliensis ATCC 700358]OCF90996.1 hypothetical protein AW168_09300 [Nocardia brasiliensis]